MIFVCDICEKTFVTMYKDKTRCYFCVSTEDAWRRQIAKEQLDQKTQEG